jgi:uncharacterized protein
MSINTSVPGVYIEENASPSISVSSNATAIPLFIGRFKPIKSELAGVITRISSWLEYTTLFDATLTASANVSIQSPSYKITAPTEVQDPVASIALKLYFQNGGGPCYICPLEKSDDTQQLAALPNLIDKVGEITLIACTENDKAYCTAVYGALDVLLNQHKGYFLLANSPDGKAPAGVSPSSQIGVYYPDLLVTYVRKFEDKNVHVSNNYNGSIQHNTLDHWRTNPDYFKAFLAVIDQSLNEEIPKPLYIQPSALMAAVYCKTDRERGVWKAPANVVLSGVNDVSVRVTDDAQGVMNTAGVNVIRYFTGRGVTVWGARTLETDSDDWRYIPVRRLFDAAERDIKKALQSMVFEPNSQPTWKRVQAAVENYLYHLWRQGGLAGDKEEEAYFVRIGKDITMTDDDINQGKMIIQVGMAAVRPAEFIILQFTQDLGQ